jgi:D-alanyl-D-alanine carboxypeptidase
MRVRRNTSAVAILALSFLLMGTGAATAAPSKLQRTLNGIVSARGGPPGIAVLIDSGRRAEFLGAGFADLESRRRPHRNEHVRIASVSKGFNAFVAFRLAGGPRPLGLGDTLGGTVPGVLPNAEGVTLRQLLQHTSGLSDYIRAPAFLERFVAEPAGYFAPTELTGYVRDEPLEFAPGSRYHYSDTDNIAAALMEEAASGRTYEQLLRREVFRPLSMRRSSLPRTVAMPRPFMRGYDLEPGRPPDDVSEVINPSGAWASGGIVSTPADLGRFAGAYVRLALRATGNLAQAFRPGSSSPPGPGRNFAGLGIFRYRTGCGTVYGHTGSFPGYRLFLAADARGRRSVVFVVNSQIVPGQGSEDVSDALRQAQARAVCRALR